MSKSELEVIKANLGCDSRRLMQLYNENIGTEYSRDLCEAANKADAAYEAMKSVLERFK